ncbi:MAG: MBL fold metallo-hydrolase [Acidobacteriaceae bacterium]|nr:MBL fold metallo-hydrolase [Acidobacteriaceae bacterium]
MMRMLSSLFLAPLVVSAALAQTNSPNPHEWRMRATDSPVQISEHVWMVKGMPNIAIVVGTRSVLVVDTGMGPKYGAMAAQFAAKLAPGKKLFLTTTHFHPEHAGGDENFPPSTVLIRNDVQQTEIEQSGMEMVNLFRGRSEEYRRDLEGVSFREPDVTFHKEAKLELGGGVTVRLMWLGGAHTVGDELVFVDPDATLVSGDVVQNKTPPMIFTQVGKGGTPSSWLHVLDKLEKLHAQHVVPDHSEPGDGSLVEQERSTIAEIRTSALSLKQSGVSVEQAGQQISAKFKQEHPDWFDTNVSGFVKNVYDDPDTNPM